MSSKITAFGVPGGIRRMATLKSGDGLRCSLRCMSLRSVLAITWPALHVLAITCDHYSI
jgi:hypothetical protein